MTPICTAGRDGLFSRHGVLDYAGSGGRSTSWRPIKAWRDFRKARVTFVTTTYVFDEVTTFFNSKGHHAKALAIGESLLNSPLVRVVHVDEALFTQAWLDFSRHADKRYSLTDCVSFVVMKQHRIEKALAFDKHFTQAGFERIP